MTRMAGAIMGALVAVLGFGGPAAAGAQGGRIGAPGRIGYDEALALVVENSYELQLADQDVLDALRRVKRAKRQYHPRFKAQGTIIGDLLEVGDWSRERNFGAGFVLDWSPFRNGELLRENTTSRVGRTKARLQRRQAGLDLRHEFRRLYHELLDLQDEVELGKLKRGIVPAASVKDAEVAASELAACLPYGDDFSKIKGITAGVIAALRDYGVWTKADALASPRHVRDAIMVGYVSATAQAIREFAEEE